jgi:phage repressor protein C with HTH and peptisase S24 domain/DNA-binding XRE family transcriptional regulator
MLSDTQRMDLARAIRAGRTRKKLTQKQLGDHFGVSKSAVAQWESGTNLPDPRKLPELVRYLEIDPYVAIGTNLDALQTDSSLPQNGHPGIIAPSMQSPSGEGGPQFQRTTPVPVQRDEMPKDVPVLGTTQGGSEGDFEMNIGEPVDFVRRPPRIARRKDVFCLIVQGDSMSPWREPGQLVYVEVRPPRNGDYVVVEMLPEPHGDLRAAYIKKLVGVTPTKIRLEQYKPSRVIELDRRKVGRILRVMDWSELLGV